jgi:2-(1,2-epoxy-1,2-dihydrophenyl)acetyl-CoA isomerase
MSFNGTGAPDDVYGEVSDGVGTITLNRPDRRNALSPAMVEGLGELLRVMEASDAVGAIVLTGAGKAFCAGGDVQAFDEQGGEGRGAVVIDPALVEGQRHHQRETVGRIYRCSKPVVASLPGAAAGAGLGLALAADLRIGGPRTVMATAFGAVGLSGDFGVAWLLARVVGPAKARELLFLSTRVEAHECTELGLLNWLVDEAELGSRTREIALQLANGPSLALAYMKDNLVRASHESLEESMDAEVPLHKTTGLTDDHRGAVRAFVEKRTPEFARPLSPS